MSLCCFGGFSKQKKKKDNFTELSQYLVDYAIKYRLHTPPRCPCTCKKLAYDVQWRHLNATTELLEFKIQPHDINSQVLQDSSALIDKSERNGQNVEKLELEGTSKSNDNSSNQPDDATEKFPDQKDHDTQKECASLKGAEKDGSQDGAQDIVEGCADIEENKTSGGEDNEQEIDEGCAGVEEYKKSGVQETGNKRYLGSDTIKSKVDSVDEEKIELLGKTEDSPATKNKEEQKEKSITNILAKWKTKIQSKTARSEDLESDTDEEEETPAKPGQIDIRKHPDETKEKTLISHKPKPRELSLFKTEYTNTSTDKQKFTFHTERKTTSSMNINVQKSYTLGGQLNLALALPVLPAKLVDPLSVTGALTGQYQFTKSKTESVQTEQMWSVNNEVEVAEGKRVIAEMRVMEEEAFATFRVKHIITPMPNATHIPIYVVHKAELMKDPEDRKVLDVFSIKNKNLYRAFQTDKAKQNGIAVCDKTNSIEFISKGTVKCVYQSKQMIDVKEEDIEGYSKKKDKPGKVEDQQPEGERGALEGQVEGHNTEVKTVCI